MAQLGITAYLQVNNTGDAVAWYERVFAATEKRARLVTPDGACMNAEIVIAGTLIMLATKIREVPEGEMVAAFQAMFG